ncbi:hypothetical protein [Marinobacter sp. F4206]|uniref:hypothetical protein n=1 Tax=Marinobacter sp. F4206 TaxID=2861777 RepID=UPI001C5DFDF1|nr:hypothetical protein [Marinobacter sp. F4206]MBW4935853.1 hypothetical protein [Marinobacter sp. F4206]
MEASLILSLFSLLIATCGFIYSAYNIERDKAKVKAWAEVVSHSNFDESGTRFNVFKVTVANVGRRPIIIKGFKIQAKGLSFDIPAKDPDFDVVYEIGPDGDNKKVLDSIRHDFSKKNTCVALKEGDFFENELSEENSYNDMIAFIDGEFYEGEMVYVEDIQGRLYMIEDCKNKMSLFHKKT